MWELTKSFRFEAAHALSGTTFGKLAEQIHGHSFRAEVSEALDHKLLNNVEALGPPTLENLSRFIWERVQHAGRVTKVSVYRDSCNESCSYYGPHSDADTA